jgi:hypothetical protein
MPLSSWNLVFFLVPEPRDLDLEWSLSLDGFFSVDISFSNDPG